MTIIDAQKNCSKLNAVVAPFIDDTATELIRAKGKALYVSSKGIALDHFTVSLIQLLVLSVLK